MSGVGAVSTFSRPISSVAFGYQIYYVTVRATKGQPYATIQARLKTGDAQTNASGERTWQIGATTDERGNHPTAVADTSTVAKPWTEQVKIGKGLTPTVPAGQPTSLSPNAPGASCATGGFFFLDENGVTTPAYNVAARIWDQDSSGGDDLLAIGFAGSDGRYNVCFESTDFDQGGGQEVYVQFVAANNAWRIRDTAASNQDWRWGTGVFNYGDPGGTHEFGNLQPANTAEHRALHAEDAVNKLYNWNGGFIDDPGETRQLVVNWTPTSTDGTYADVLGANDVHLAADDPDSDHITIHEASHVFMDALYEDDFPPFPNCSPHFIFGNSSTGCAWEEGWAEWVPARVLNDPYFRFEDGTGPNLETPTWNDGNPNGDQAEGRIAGTLIDLSDNTNEGNWDRFGEAEGYGAGFEETILVARTRVSDTLAEYFTIDRPGIGSMGFPARTAVIANTNDYAAYPNRFPLTNGVELTPARRCRSPRARTTTPSPRPRATGAESASGAPTTTTSTLYDDEAQATLLGSSAFGGTAIDYVLVDSNSGHRPVGDSYFPRTTLFSGSGAYNIEQSADSVTHRPGRQRGVVRRGRRPQGPRRRAGERGGRVRPGGPDRGARRGRAPAPRHLHGIDLGPGPQLDAWPPATTWAQAGPSSSSTPRPPTRPPGAPWCSPTWVAPARRPCTATPPPPPARC